MRLDMFLKVSRLVKRRPLAHDLCEAGRVLVNGKPGKPSHSVKIGDELEVRGERFVRRVRVLVVPEGQKSKAQAADLYELLQETPVDFASQLPEPGPEAGPADD